MIRRSASLERRRYPAAGAAWTSSSLDPQGIVEPVEEAAQRDAQGQFADLYLGEMLPQAFEQAVMDAVGSLPRDPGIFDHQPIHRIQLPMIGLRQPVDGLGRDPFHGQERPMMG